LKTIRTIAICESDATYLAQPFSDYLNER